MEDEEIRRLADAIERAMFQAEKKIRIPCTSVTIRYVCMEGDNLGGLQIFISWRRS